jgi:hypothetical protein
MNRLAIEVIVVAFALIFGAIFGAGETNRNLTNRYDAELAQLRAANSQAITDAVNKARSEEQQRSAAMAALDEQHHKEYQDEIISKDRTIADLRAGTVRVRNQFTCPAAAAERATGKAGTGTGLGDGAGTGGLQTAHVEFLLREAGRADEAVRQLQACQAIVRQDRGQ